MERVKLVVQQRDDTGSRTARRLPVSRGQAESSNSGAV